MRRRFPAIAAWLTVKCLNCKEFVVIGWTDPEGARPFLGTLLLGYYDPAGRLPYPPRRHRHQSGRARATPAPSATDGDRHDAARRGSATLDPLSLPLVLSRVHWVRPELVAEVKFLTWTDDNLLRQGCL
jgi:ATP-dependent DNA ligase